MYNNPANDQNTYPMYYHQPTNTVQQLHPQTPFSNVNLGFDDDDGGGDGGDEFPRLGERLPQWGYQETKDLIEIRAQLEWDHSASKRRKNMWEMVAGRMRDKGYVRTSEQCKGKWKNLVNRYKNYNPSPDNARQFPFFDEMFAVFTARANRTTRMADQLLPDQRKQKKRSKSAIPQQGSSSGEELDDHDDEEADAVRGENTPNNPKAKSIGSKRKRPMVTVMKKNTLASIEEMVKNFTHEQQAIDAKWREIFERREKERDDFEEEWRDNMKKLEKDRLDMHRAWREREEQRWAQEQSRAEKRDEVLTLVLRRMARDDK